MKLYAYTAPGIPQHDGFLKIGETNGSVEKRVEQQGRELNVEKVIVWRDAVIADRTGIDKKIHRYLKAQGFQVQQFGTGHDTEWVKCTVGDLEKAFAVIKEQLYQDEIKRQALGNKFYLEIRNWYYWASEQLPDPEIALRLVVRLLFCYFLQEKGLVPDNLFDERFVKEHLKDNEFRYYNAILCNLFFRCLNTPINERSNIEQKNLIKKGSPVTEQFKQIPFLNGGIFNEHEGDDVPLNDDFFFSDVRSRHLEALGGNYNVAGIIRILSQYQYKLTLDDLLDQAEYGDTVDPEFIGKVFESLLACIDADSKETRRKITGSYYTPREIVDYMVVNALDAYSQNSDDLLQCKILDPACGSGAFPCGIMNEIMRRIDPDRELDITERHRRKLEIIRKVIYGVDIQPMAVQIAQLRLFLSLIQEITPDKKKNNFGIEPLPNLETKFVCADTLIGLEKKEKNGQGWLEEPIVREKIDELRDTRSQYFMARYVQDKKRLQEYDAKIRKQLTVLMVGTLTRDETKKLVAWNPYNASHSSPFFNPTWMFGIEKFDIVIGNPPYVEAKKLKKIAVNLKHYDVYSGTADLSVYFIERGLDLLKNKGLLMLITTNKFFNTEYGKLVRKKIIKHQIRNIIDFEQVKVFDEVLVSSVVIGIDNSTPSNDDFVYQKFYKLNNNAFKAQFVEKRDFGSYKQSLLDAGEWSFSDNTQLALKNKIEKAGTRLSKLLGVAVYRGVTTGYNPAFIIDESKKNEMIATDANSEKLITPLLQGRNIKKWVYNGTNDFLLQTGFDIDVENYYPAIFKHLRQFRKDLMVRADQGKSWFNLRACKYYHEFEKPEKIIWGLTADKWAFAHDDRKHYLPSNGYILTSKKIPIKYLLGLFNSKLLKFYFGFIGIMTAGGAFTLKHATIQQFPIVITDNQQPIIDLVNKILSEKKKNLTADTTTLERKIDALVYELYGLTDEEIALIEKQ